MEKKQIHHFFKHICKKQHLENNQTKAVLRPNQSIKLSK